MTAGTEAAIPPAVPAKTPPKLNPVRVHVPESPVEERVHNFEEIIHPYTLEDAVLEAKRCIQCRRPWCVEACPISQDCREYILKLAERDFDGAARVTLRDDPMATTLCKVCYHYCEDACVVKKKGVPIAIRQLKRSSLELGKSDLVYVAQKPRDQRVAIVGGGPAGVMAAWELGIRGYGVTVYEQEELLGGLVLSIPSYRVTDREVQEDLARFRDLDVTFVKSTKVGVTLPAEKLLEQGYAAVLLTLGTPLHRKLNIPGEDLPGVVPALRMLLDLHHGRPAKVGKRIMVIGGGDVAMDAIRSSVRLSQGGEVTLVYRRTEEEMPADREELLGAKEEGVKFLWQKAPVRIVGSDRVEGLVVQRVELGPPDASGRRAPVLVPGSEETLPCDTVIVAVGQRSDTTGFDSDLDLRVTAQGWVEGKGPDLMTGVEGVFAAGGKSVVYAMAAGMRAAEAIDGYLRKKKGEAPAPRPDPFGGSTPFHLPAGYAKANWNPNPTYGKA
ncbi:MAG: FAD-dependent oxidoreductase [Euryarchaeota archaeon]|nr:FAD-dependent oxidoreductase [Euryarchaeota archaeon]MDE1879394.1 FAD-dependent oxidoreductase [Euryarchaeota archaeon]MDE2044082.1 FAD-dependent oxidoreductase [Thermoplasmata archaeon]